MKVPRDVSATQLVKSLKQFGYEVTRQVGSHMRLTTTQKGQHHITFPAHRTLTIGKVNAVIWEVVQHFQISRDEVIQRLFA